MPALYSVGRDIEGYHCQGQLGHDYIYTRSHSNPTDRIDGTAGISLGERLAAGDHGWRKTHQPTAHGFRGQDGCPVILTVGGRITSSHLERDSATAPYMTNMIKRPYRTVTGPPWLRPKIKVEATTSQLLKRMKATEMSSKKLIVLGGFSTLPMITAPMWYSQL